MCLEHPGANLERFPLTKDGTNGASRGIITVMNGNIIYVRRNEFIMASIQ